MGVVRRPEGTPRAQFVEEGPDHRDEVNAEPPLGGAGGAEEGGAEGAEEGPDHDGPAPHDAPDAQLEAHGQEEDEEELDEHDVMVPSLGGEAQEAQGHEDGVGRGEESGGGLAEGGVHEGPDQAGAARQGAHEHECRPPDQLVRRRVGGGGTEGQPVPVSRGDVGGEVGGGGAARCRRGLQAVTARRVHRRVVHDLVLVSDGARTPCSGSGSPAPLLGKVGVSAEPLHPRLAGPQFAEGVELDLRGVPPADGGAPPARLEDADARKAAVAGKGQVPGAVHAAGAGQAGPRGLPAAEVPPRRPGSLGRPAIIGRSTWCLRGRSSSSSAAAGTGGGLCLVVVGKSAAPGAMAPADGDEPAAHGSNWATATCTSRVYEYVVQ